MIRERVPWRRRELKVRSAGARDIYAIRAPTGDTRDLAVYQPRDYKYATTTRRGWLVWVGARAANCLHPRQAAALFFQREGGKRKSVRQSCRYGEKPFENRERGGGQGGMVVVVV